MREEASKMDVSKPNLSIIYNAEGLLLCRSPERDLNNELAPTYFERQAISTELCQNVLRL